MSNELVLPPGVAFVWVGLFMVMCAIAMVWVGKKIQARQDKLNEKKEKDK